ncbi:MAG: polyprenyl synthetase family protein [Clostridiales Family XIII bacterium]|jgi:geranylgeranyl diphosphate synthase type II|nr:polyprenyl synthetase family protein [Clostridiales Family XIII bacterium]
MRDFEEYAAFKDLTEEHILDFLPEVDSKSSTLYEAMRYSLQSGGKRIRPVLLLAACEFAGGEAREALPYACAIEYIHTYSLIHDDLPCMDDDELRRGLPTNHTIYGEGMAVLAGDGLLTTAFEAMNRDMLIYFDDPVKLKRRVRASHEISKGAGCRGMAAGQAADIEAAGKSIAGGLLDYIHVNKTAALIVAAVKAGAFIGGATKDVLAALENYAENLGLAFQIADDILDVTGDENELGKRTGADRSRRKPTYPSLYGVAESRKRLDALTENALATLAPFYDNAEFFTKMAKHLVNRTK